MGPPHSRALVLFVQASNVGTPQRPSTPSPISAAQSPFHPPLSLSFSPFTPCPSPPSPALFPTAVHFCADNLRHRPPPPKRSRLMESCWILAIRSIQVCSFPIPRLPCPHKHGGLAKWIPNGRGEKGEKKVTRGRAYSDGEGGNEVKDKGGGKRGRKRRMHEEGAVFCQVSPMGGWSYCLTGRCGSAGDGGERGA